VASRSPAAPSPQARRQAQIQALRIALAARDRRAIERLLGQWVHRQGVNQVAALSRELAAAEPEGWAWWQAQQGQTSEPQAAELALPDPPQPPATRPAPAPSHPAVVQLRAWLPDREGRRAA
jgi:hypothetical protein